MDRNLAVHSLMMIDIRSLVQKVANFKKMIKNRIFLLLLLRWYFFKIKLVNSKGDLGALHVAAFDNKGFADFIDRLCVAIRLLLLNSVYPVNFFNWVHIKLSVVENLLLFICDSLLGCDLIHEHFGQYKRDWNKSKHIYWRNFWEKLLRWNYIHAGCVNADFFQYKGCEWQVYEEKNIKKRYFSEG